MKTTFIIILFFTNYFIAQNDSIQVMFNYINEDNKSLITDTNINLSIFKNDTIIFSYLRKDTTSIIVNLEYNQIYEVESSINDKYLFHKESIYYAEERKSKYFEEFFEVKKNLKDIPEKLNLENSFLTPFKLSKNESLLSWDKLRFRTKLKWIEEYQAYGKKALLTDKNLSLNKKSFVIQGFLKSVGSKNEFILFKSELSLSCLLSEEEDIYGKSKVIEVNFKDSIDKSLYLNGKEVYLKGEINIDENDTSSVTYSLNNSEILKEQDIE